jgi:hypothetical protein
LFFLIYLACGLYLWLLGAAVLGGWKTGRSLFRAPWLGYAVLIACLQIAHFFTAINPPFSWTFLAVSVLSAGGVVVLKFLRSPLKAKKLPAMPPLLWFALLIVVAWLAFRPVFNIATQKIVHYDVGYYYLQTIAWTTAFPIVAGLGNLLLNLGFNQSAFLVPAFLDSLGPRLWGYSLLGGVFPWLGLTLSVFALVQGLCALFLLRRRLAPIEKAYAISLPAWLYTLFINNLSGNSPDIALACLQIHLFLCFASFLVARGSPAVRLQLSEIITLCALSVCVKLNSVFFAAAIGLLSIGVALTYIGVPRLFRGKQVIYATLAALVLCLPWTARGIIVSGYPLFPSTALVAPVAWRVPKADVANFYDITVDWGRQPYPDLAKVRNSFAWVPEFLQRNWNMTDQFAWPLSLGALWTLLFLALAWKSANFRQGLRRLLLLILPVAFALLMWFFTAPNPRYLGSITWLLPLAPLLALISNISFSALAFVTLAFCVNYLALGTLRYNTEWSWKKPAPRSPEIPKVDLREGNNPFGVHLYYPRKGDQTFDAPLPSAKTLHPTLKYLDGTRGLAGGFCDARINDRDSENDDGAKQPAAHTTGPER